MLHHKLQLTSTGSWAWPSGPIALQQEETRACLPRDLGVLLDQLLDHLQRAEGRSRQDGSQEGAEGYVVTCSSAVVAPRTLMLSSISPQSPFGDGLPAGIRGGKALGPSAALTT